MPRRISSRASNTLNGGIPRDLQKKESTQELLGIESITDYGISTKQGELIFFAVAPTNLSVLPADSIDARINALLNIIKGYDGIEMIAMDSMQSFEYNKRFYRDRLEKETCPLLGVCWSRT